jgi:peptidylprolyl isomerase/FKBP-type peptidyl-prolyl cis-trans isomerase FkpA
VKQPIKMVPGASGQPEGINQLLAGIKPGEKRHGTIPYYLGFGETGERVMPAYATMVFDVEAVSIVTKSAALERDIKMLKIEDEVVGTGPEAKEGTTAELHYTGMFPDGKKFDSSHDRNQTFTVKVGAGQVIRGFDLGILGMKVGGKRRVSIPADLGYGARGAGGVIPPNQDLVFEIELISVK